MEFVIKVKWFERSDGKVRSGEVSLQIRHFHHVIDKCSDSVLPIAQAAADVRIPSLDFQ